MFQKGPSTATDSDRIGYIRAALARDCSDHQRLFIVGAVIDAWRDSKGNDPEAMLFTKIRECVDTVRSGPVSTPSGAAPAETSESIALKRLSLALTGGNAATWDEVFHAAESTEPLADLRTHIEGMPPEGRWVERSAVLALLGAAAAAETKK